MNELSVILVDDQRLIREGLRSVLRDYKIKVIGEADNGFDLLDLLRKEQPDVVLLDINIPELNGKETLVILRHEFPHVKTIIFSEYGDEEIVKSFMNAGANAYISKNTRVEILVEAIYGVKENGIYTGNLPELLTSEVFNRKRENFKSQYTNRERDIIALVCKGLSVKEIAAKLEISEKTVESNMTEIYKKAKVRSRADFLIYAINEGLHFL